MKHQIDGFEIESKFSKVERYEIHGISPELQDSKYISMEHFLKSGSI